MTTSSADGAAPRGGQAGAAIRQFDWSQSSLAHREHWPSLLRSTLNRVLESPESLYLLWGPQKQFFFNDAYRSVAWSAVPDPQHIHAVGRDMQAER